MFGDLFQDEVGIGGSSAGSDTATATGTWAWPAVTNMEIPLPPRLSSGLCGIYNQGATCYLNSLLQTLLMTSEFREALFQLGPDELGCLEDKDKPKAKVRVIPIQLQRLFARLLLLNAQGASTTELTDSFGWTNSEELQQHDVQELNRILFSAIEDSLVGTSGQTLIQDLYHGTIVNQIICQMCGRTSEREEDFLDLCIAVSGNSTLQQGLHNSYVYEELMEGNNKYHCEECRKLVNAKKRAKLRHLPPIITISLLRFSFDFHKMERYKETGKFVFPQKLDMSPYCESKAMVGYTKYELFSIVIHRGSTHGGHYHAYIRDKDGLGKWTHPDEEEILLPTDPATGKVDFIEFDSPIELLQAILHRNGTTGMSVDKLCAELVNQTGVSWNNRFKRQYGAIGKFLKKYNDKFIFSPASNWVSLKQYSAAAAGDEDGGDCGDGDGPMKMSAPASAPAAGETDRGDMKCRPSKRRPVSPPPEPGQCWFDFNDSRVQPIRTSELEKQFSGKESAYMLSYRLADFSTSGNSRFGDPSYGIPPNLLEEIALENAKLSSWREAFENQINQIFLHVHFDAFYHLWDGALHPKSDSLSSLDLSIDRRKTVLDLKNDIFQLGTDLVPPKFVVHLAKEKPAGLHLYDCVSENEQESIMSTSIANNSHLFVWDGNQVHGDAVLWGESLEPILLTLAHGQSKRMTCGYPKSLTIGELRCIVCDHLNLPTESVRLSKLITKGDSSCVITLTSADDGRSLVDLQLKDRDIILAEHVSCPSTDPGKLAEEVLVSSNKLMSFIVENRLGPEPEESWPVLPIEVETDASVEELKAVILSGLSEAEAGADPCRLRVDDEHLGLRAPLHELQSLNDAGLRQGLKLVLEHGPAPLNNQISLRFSVAPHTLGAPKWEIIFESSSSVRSCLSQIVDLAQLTGQEWHLRGTNWCGEAANVLDDLEQSLEACNIKNGDLLLVEEGSLPPKGFLKMSAWLLPTQDRLGQNSSGMLDWISTTIQGMLGSGSSDAGCDGDCSDCSISNQAAAGDVVISKQATLADLKQQLLTLPVMSQFSVPSTDFLRVRILENRRPTLVLQGSNQTLQRLKLTSSTHLGLQVLPEEEDLNQNQILLHVQQRIPDSKKYYPSRDLVWELAHGATAHSLCQAIADSLNIPVDKTLIAKHLSARYEWLVIKDNPQQHKGTSGKGNKKKGAKKTNIKHAPYHISDGDTIGVKDLRLEQEGNSTDFSSAHDHAGLRRLKQEAEERKKKREDAKRRNAMVDGSGGGDTTKTKRPERGIKIHVADFR